MGVKKGELQRLRDENSKLNNSIMSLRFIIINFFKSIEGLSVQQKVIFHGLLNELADYYTGDKKDGCSEEVLYLVSRMEESEAYEQKAMRVYKLWGLL